MFALSIQELVVIFIVALVVFGPKRLPELGRNLGKGILELRKAMEGIREQMREETDALKTLERPHIDEEVARAEAYYDNTFPRFESWNAPEKEGHTGALEGGTVTKVPESVEGDRANGR